MSWANDGFAYIKENSSLTTAEKIASMFQPDTLLSAQYFDTLRRKTHLEPEKRLMLAVLEDAVHCYQDNIGAEKGKKRKLFEEAAEWFVDGDGDWFFSFVNISETLGVNPQYLRRGLFRRRERTASQLMDGRRRPALRGAGKRRGLSVLGRSRLGARTLRPGARRGT